MGDSWHPDVAETLAETGAEILLRRLAKKLAKSGQIAFMADDAEGIEKLAAIRPTGDGSSTI